MSENATPATPTDAYEVLAPAFDLAEALKGGTRAFRASRTEYLPKYAGEGEEKYQDRLARTVLYGGWRKTVQNLCAMPFTKPGIRTAPEKDVTRDPREAALDESCDRKGQSIQEFARRRLRSMLEKGRAMLLVEYPQRPPSATLQDQVTQDLRPYFVPVDPSNVIGWKFELEVSGRKTLQELRILDYGTEPDGTKWGTRTVKRVRVYRPGSLEVYRHDETAQREEAKWTLERSQEVSLNRIPFVFRTAGEQDTDPLSGTPPLDDLAVLNVEHWQSSSDQSNILHVARVPIFTVRGVPQGTIDPRIGMGQYYEFASPEARAEYVEIGGESIKAGREAIQDIESRMESMGIEMLIKRNQQQETATKAALRSQEQTCQLQDMVARLEDLIHEAYQVAGEWVSQEFTTRWKFFTDFGIEAKETQDLELLLKARLAGELSRETWLREIGRRTVVKSLDVEAELSSIAQEEGAIPGEES